LEEEFDLMLPSNSSDDQYLAGFLAIIAVSLNCAVLSLIAVLNNLRELRYTSLEVTINIIEQLSKDNKGFVFKIGKAL
jgi:hypothetical protein